MLIATAVISLGLAATGELWSKTAQRDREQDLLFIDNQYRQAIADYYERSPGGAKQYLQKLETSFRTAATPPPSATCVASTPTP